MTAWLTKSIHWRQKVPSGVSSRTTGAGEVLPVCSSVRTSKVSSIVPRPPGKMANAFEGRVIATLRVKKYCIATSIVSASMYGLENCSKGSSMFTPSVCSRPAPLAEASMMPGPAPEMIIQPRSAITAPRSRAIS